jgi:hypothetical protein
MVADLDPVGLPPPQEVQIVDDQQPHLTRQHAVQDPVAELAGRALETAGVAEKLQQRPVEVLHAGVAGQPDPADRPPLMPLLGVVTLRGELAAVKLPGERQHRGGLA